jgi:hypothetical protein
MPEGRMAPCRAALLHQSKTFSPTHHSPVNAKAAANITAIRMRSTRRWRSFSVASSVPSAIEPRLSLRQPRKMNATNVHPVRPDHSRAVGRNDPPQLRHRQARPVLIQQPLDVQAATTVTAVAGHGQTDRTAISPTLATPQGDATSRTAGSARCSPRWTKPYPRISDR